MSSSEKNTLRTDEEVLHTVKAALHNAESCRYNVNGMCILSDCKCQAAADGHTVCSSFSED